MSKPYYQIHPTAESTKLPTLMCVFKNAKDKNLESNLYRFNSKVAFWPRKDVFLLYKETYDNMFRLIKGTNMAKMSIHFIVHPDSINKAVPNLLTVDEFKQFQIHVHSYEEFFKLLSGEDFKSSVFFDYLNQSIYIFENTTWSVLAFLFRSRGYILSGGTNTKRHILSVLEFRLSQFLFTLYTESDVTVHQLFEEKKSS